MAVVKIFSSKLDNILLLLNKLIPYTSVTFLLYDMDRPFKEDGLVNKILNEVVVRIDLPVHEILKLNEPDMIIELANDSDWN